MCDRVIKPTEYSHFDVAVFGAGPSGIAAAYTAAMKGLKTVLIESANKIGGVMATCPGMMLGGGYPLDVCIGGFFEKFVKRLYAVNKAEQCMCAIEEFGKEVIYDHEYAITELYKMLKEANVDLRLNALPLDVYINKDQIEGVAVADIAGICLVHSDMYLDCTGNGDIAHKAGIPSKVGNEGGLMMGGTVTFFMENVDWDKAFESDDIYFTHYAKKGITEGKLHPDIPEIYFIKGFRPNSVYFNTVTMAGVDGCNPKSVLAHSIEARTRCHQLADFCKSDIPGFENAWINYIGPLIGIRETRKLEGMHKITIQEIANGTKFEDGIVASDNPIDDVFRGDIREYSNKRSIVKGSYYTIPLRSLVPQKVKNLMFAGRNISADTYAFASVRGMPQCMLMGESIALAADIAIKNSSSVQDVDRQLVVEAMIDHGVRGLNKHLLLTTT